MIRPCRESITGWAPEAQALPGNRNSLVLNERGPALKVFWSRKAGWAPDRCACGLCAGHLLVREKMTKKPSRRELGRRRPVRSFRFELGVKKASVQTR